MESRHHRDCSRSLWGIAILGLLTPVIAALSTHELSEAWGSRPAGSPPVVQQGPFHQIATPLLPRGQLRRLPPLTKSVAGREIIPGSGSVELIPEFAGTGTRHQFELVSAITPHALPGREPWHGVVQGGETTPQAAWPLPPGMPLDGLPPVIEPGPSPETFSRPPPFDPGPAPEAIRSRDSVELIPSPDPIALAPEPADYHEDLPVGRWLPRLRPRSLLSPLIWGLVTHRESRDRGIGYERVATAPFIIDIAQPMNHFALRVDAVHGWGLPDRAEALFARPSSFGLGGKGPAMVDRSVSFQDLAFVSEMGGPAFSVRTLIPLRLIDPESNTDTTGLGDIQTSTKTRLLDGESWTITQVNNVYIQSGNAAKGLGTGHTSMEMGVLAGYKWTDETYLHGEVKFLVPMGGHPSHQGNILRWGFGVSHLWYDSDSFALIPTLETVFYSILDGEATVMTGAVPSVRRVDGETISTVHYGLRIVSDNGSDFGLVEWGVSGGFNLGSNGWYDTLLRLEFRTMY